LWLEIRWSQSYTQECRPWSLNWNVHLASGIFISYMPLKGN
jgi:hypothetical protein